MGTNHPFTLKLDMNVLNHLGIGLYSSTPAVVTEIIANAWDADAKVVKIEIAPDSITVSDDGHGMGAKELQERFLRVGYARRDQGKGNQSDTKGRKVMGRKGIGKLAMFSLADTIEVWSKKVDADPVAVKISVDNLKAAIKKNGDYQLELAGDTVKWADGQTGTKIVLSSLSKGTDKTEAFLRPRIARRFSVIGQLEDFKVVINDREVSPQDRGYHSDIQFWWDLDDKTRSEEMPLATNLASDEAGNPCVARLDDVVIVDQQVRHLRGFISTVFKPAMLKKTDDNINQISLFANGRVFQEDMLRDIGNSRVFNSYLVGEIHADFLDSDGVDRATANREAVKQGDPAVTAVREWLKAKLAIIAEQWDAWRRQQDPTVEDDKTAAALEKWYAGLVDSRDRKLAQKLIRPILSTEYANDSAANTQIRRDLIRGAIIGFEKLRVRKELDKLDAITDVTSLEFQKIFHTVSDVEASLYHDITHSRLQVIDKFQAIKDAQSLEKVAQQYLFGHLWLLDPTWDRVGGSEVMEQTLTAELKAIDPEAETGARIDIAYRTSSGRHVIVELKRPGLKRVDVFSLMRQGSKYKAAIKSYLGDHPDLHKLGGRLPPIDVYFVTEKKPHLDDGDAVAMLRSADMQCFTYDGMIENSKRAYQEYLAGSTLVSEIDSVIKDIQ
ncbi:BbrUII/HgiDII family restriction enzyme [Stenotrophomonas geniculata]|uniref:BbrUII/HgiDII family restriction enzyme n=1 Tax=Stenotrophomonas geniculata TaxID=86188 RepID=UPI002E7694F5|nr:ATP-binding protein [Stenotrophomonas geniculata]